jgi:hypothetical protein
VNIDTAALHDEYVRAATTWPFIHGYELTAGLPTYMLFAVGSRETNLRNVVGDGGHGHGVWQLDNRSHAIPPGFDADVPLQCATAARMLAGLLAHFGGNERAALAAYNAGAGTVDYNLSNHLDIDSGTAGGDYSADTLQRRLALLDMFPPAQSNTEVLDMDAVTAITEHANQLAQLIERGDVGPDGQALPPDHNTHPYNLTFIYDEVIANRARTKAIMDHLGIADPVQ